MSGLAEWLLDRGHDVGGCDARESVVTRRLEELGARVSVGHDPSHVEGIDAGRSDEYFLDLGAEAFRAEIAQTGLPDERVHFELFDAGHGGIDYRYPLSLGWLAERLAR